MIISTIKFSQIEDRIDAEYYKPEYLEIFKAVRDGVKLEEVTIVTSGTQPEIFSQRGFKFFSIKDIDNIFLDDSDIRYIDEDFYQKNPDGQITKDDIVLAITGATIGKVAVNTFEKAFISGDLVRIRCKNISSYYLIIFLLSKFGQGQIYKNIFGATNKHLSPRSVKNFYIPVSSKSFQQKIEKMVREAERKRKLADEKYKEAEKILNKELELENLDLSTQKAFEAKFSETEDRFDPEYYQPKYKRIIQLLKSGERRNKFELYDLDEILTVKRGSLIDNGYYWSIGIPYIRIKDLTPHGITSNNFVYINKFQAKIGEYETIREGDQLLTVIGATVGKICHVPKEFEGSFFSNNISRLRLKKEFSFRIDTIYLESVLRSIVCQTQILRNATQTAQPKLNDAEVRNMIIPILPKTTQQKISSLIQESMKLHKGARKLIDRAKKEVKAMVEGRMR